MKYLEKFLKKKKTKIGLGVRGLRACGSGSVAWECVVWACVVWKEERREEEGMVLWRMVWRAAGGGGR